jgi:hypothetical protein
MYNIVPLQDVIQFGPLVKTLGLVMLNRPQVLPSIFKQVDVGKNARFSLDTYNSYKLHCFPKLVRLAWQLGLHLYLSCFHPGWTWSHPRLVRPFSDAWLLHIPLHLYRSGCQVFFLSLVSYKHFRYCRTLSVWYHLLISYTY